MAIDPDRKKFDTMALKAIQLSKLAPLLTSAAHKLEEEAKRQQSSSVTISEGSNSLTDELSRTLELLQATATGLMKSVQVVRRIADQTRMLALNASIQAAAVGAQGKGFEVVAQAVKELSDQTATATVEINQKLGEMNQRVKDAARFTGAAEPEGATQEVSLTLLSREIGKVAQIAAGQSQSSSNLAKISNDLNSLAESLLLTLGTFRISAHEKCQAVIGQLLADPNILSLQKTRMESSMRAAIRSNHWLELLYVTDARGTQITSNIGQTDDVSALGKNWSSRPWFQNPMRSQIIETSDLYRSAATNDFCFTVSGPIQDETGKLHGILAADVNFSSMIV